MYKLHAVIIKKANIPLEKAKQISKEFIPLNRNFYRETINSYRFRNISKQKFIAKSFRTKIINPNISLIFGKLK